MAEGKSKPPRLRQVNYKLPVDLIDQLDTLHQRVNVDGTLSKQHLLVLLLRRGIATLEKSPIRGWA